ncbi:MAG: prepilin-type N-terminal cleavage/methylation domain-containing protein [Gammaproteobacteria bacterium]|nr:prepilin-type N-terminal cleavage/methylation domain-containing protein [Gammaproteobacteria bacterium]
MMRPRPSQAAFTLVELVLVIVLLGILSGILAPVIMQNIRAYSDTQARNELMARGRIALGRLERELRRAAPYSIVVSGSSIKFVTLAAGGRYLERAESAPFIANADCDHNTERFYTSNNPDKLTALCLFSTTTLTAPAADGDLALLIGNTSTTALYSYSDPGTWAPLSATVGPLQLADADYKGVLWKVTFAAPHSFSNASAYKKYQIADHTHEVRLASDALLWRRSNGISDPTSGADTLLISGVSALGFDITHLADGILTISMTLSENGESITLSEDLYARNTP